MGHAGRYAGPGPPSLLTTPSGPALRAAPASWWAALGDMEARVSLDLGGYRTEAGDLGNFLRNPTGSFQGVGVGGSQQQPPGRPRGLRTPPQLPDLQPRRVGLTLPSGPQSPCTWESVPCTPAPECGCPGTGGARSDAPWDACVEEGPGWLAVQTTSGDVPVGGLNAEWGLAPRHAGRLFLHDAGRCVAGGRGLTQ